ncbi:MAG: hypothetical protein ABIJ31_06440 [Pseudomonadota bacterium]
MGSKTFLYETYYEQKLNFEIDDDHFKFRIDSGKQLIAKWSEIDSIKISRFGNTLDILVANFPKTIKIPFVTDEFLVFLEELTSRIARANKDRIQQMDERFTVSHLFYLVMTLLLSASGILLISLLFNFSTLAQLEIFPAFVAVLLPSALILYGISIPIKAIPQEKKIILKGLVKKNTYDYSKIDSIHFELLDMKKRGKLLVVVLNMKTGKKIKIKWLKDLILFFIVTRTKFDAFLKKSNN